MQTQRCQTPPTQPRQQNTYPQHAPNSSSDSQAQLSVAALNSVEDAFNNPLEVATTVPMMLTTTAPGTPPNPTGDTNDHHQDHDHDHDHDLDETNHLVQKGPVRKSSVFNLELKLKYHPIGADKVAALVTQVLLWFVVVSVAELSVAGYYYRTDPHYIQWCPAFSFATSILHSLQIVSDSIVR
jgi:hypothetical protein